MLFFENSYWSRILEHPVSRSNRKLKKSSADMQVCQVVGDRRDFHCLLSASPLTAALDQLNGLGPIWWNFLLARTPSDNYYWRSIKIANQKRNHSRPGPTVSFFLFPCRSCRVYLRACRAKKQVLNCSLFDPSIEATLSFLGLQNKYKIAAFGLAQLSGIDIFGSDFKFFLSGWGLKTEIEAGVLRGAKPRPRQGHQMVEVGEEIGEEICERWWRRRF